MSEDRGPLQRSRGTPDRGDDGAGYVPRKGVRDAGGAGLRGGAPGEGRGGTRDDQLRAGPPDQPTRYESAEYQPTAHEAPRYGVTRYAPQRTRPARVDGENRRLRLTPARLLVLVAVVGSAALVGYGLVRRDRAQIPLLSAGMIILGITLVGAGFWAARAAWLDARVGHTGSAFIGALFGGVCVLAGSGSLAGAIVLALIWETA